MNILALAQIHVLKQVVLKLTRIERRKNRTLLRPNRLRPNKLTRMERMKSRMLLCPNRLCPNKFIQPQELL